MATQSRLLLAIEIPLTFQINQYDLNDALFTALGKPKEAAGLVADIATALWYDANRERVKAIYTNASGGTVPYRILREMLETHPDHVAAPEESERLPYHGPDGGYYKSREDFEEHMVGQDYTIIFVALEDQEEFINVRDYLVYKDDQVNTHLWVPRDPNTAPLQRTGQLPGLKIIGKITLPESAPAYPPHQGYWQAYDGNLSQDWTQFVNYMEERGFELYNHGDEIPNKATGRIYEPEGDTKGYFWQRPS